MRYEELELRGLDLVVEITLGAVETVLGNEVIVLLVVPGMLVVLMTFGVEEMTIGVVVMTFGVDVILLTLDALGLSERTILDVALGVAGLGLIRIVRDAYPLSPPKTTLGSSRF